MTDKTENCEFTSGIIGIEKIHEEIEREALKIDKLPMSIKVEEDGDGNFFVETAGSMFKLIYGIEMIAKQIATDSFPAEFIVCNALLHMTGDKKLYGIANKDEKYNDWSGDESNV